MQSRAAPSYFQSYHNSEDNALESCSSNNIESSVSVSPTSPSTLATECNGVLQVDGDLSSTSSQQHSPNNLANVAATTTTAPQRARDRLAKFTATLIGAAGNITGGHGLINSVEESESGLSIRDLEDQFMGLKIREADTMAELKEMRQKVMEMETQVIFLIILYVKIFPKLFLKGKFFKLINPILRIMFVQINYGDRTMNLNEYVKKKKIFYK